MKLLAISLAFVTFGAFAQDLSSQDYRPTPNPYEPQTLSKTLKHIETINEVECSLGDRDTIEYRGFTNGRVYSCSSAKDYFLVLIKMKNGKVESYEYLSPFP